MIFDELKGRMIRRDRVGIGANGSCSFLDRLPCATRWHEFEMILFLEACIPSFEVDLVHRAFEDIALNGEFAIVICGAAFIVEVPAMPADAIRCCTSSSGHYVRDTVHHISFIIVIVPGYDDYTNSRMRLIEVVQ